MASSSCQPNGQSNQPQATQTNDRSKMVAIVAKSNAVRISEGGEGADGVRVCDGWHHEQFFVKFFL